jgi:hypothetical protein
LNVVPAIISDPLRLVVAVFAATLNPTLPDPDPDAPLVTVIQEALLLALHAQPAPAVTALVPVPPAAENDWLAGEMLYEQLAAACVTANVVPAIVSDPLRLVVAVFAATLNPTLPDPDPDAPLVTVIHDALLLALHAQPVAAVTLLLPVPPAAVKDWLEGEIDGSQTTVPPKENVLVREPPLRPPGPMASTSASYVIPVASGDGSSDTKSTRMKPSGSGAGLPRLAVATGHSAPTT